MTDQQKGYGLGIILGICLPCLARVIASSPRAYKQLINTVHQTSPDLPRGKRIPTLYFVLP